MIKHSIPHNRYTCEQNIVHLVNKSLIHGLTTKTAEISEIKLNNHVQYILIESPTN